MIYSKLTKTDCATINSYKIINANSTNNNALLTSGLLHFYLYNLFVLFLRIVLLMNKTTSVCVATDAGLLSKRSAVIKTSH